MYWPPLFSLAFRPPPRPDGATEVYIFDARIEIAPGATNGSPIFKGLRVEHLAACWMIQQAFTARRVSPVCSVSIELPDRGQLCD